MMGAIVAILGGLSVLTVTTDARADAVDNPGYFEFVVMSGHDSHFRFTSGAGKTIDLAAGTNGNYFFADLDGDGIVSNAGSSFPVQNFNIGGSVNVTAQLQIQSTTEGRVTVPTQVIDFDEMRARIRFVYNGTPCTTSTFVIELSTLNWSAGTQGACSIPYDDSTGDFCLVASGFVVPQLAASACSNQGNAINSYFNLGVSTGSYMQVLLGNVDPVITGS